MRSPPAYLPRPTEAAGPDNPPTTRGASVPDQHRGPKPEFYESLWAEPNETAEDEEDDQRSYVLLDDEREIFVGKP